MSVRFRSYAVLALALFWVRLERLEAQTFTHFEARHTHSIGTTPDGTRLLALNSNDARLCVYDVSSPTAPQPILMAEIPVGLEPVSLRARTNDEVWVVNEVGDSVSIVSLSSGVVIDTLATPDEPADVVFAQGKAFVTCSRTNSIRVFDAESRVPLATISLMGLVPRALATDAAGAKIYTAFLHSGNRTTVLPADAAPNQPSPTNPSLPTPPKTALIIASNDSRINYAVLDSDVVEIDAITLTVTRYFSGVGTNLSDIALQPGSGDLWVANTEALNLVRFEPNLRGHFALNRLSLITQIDGLVSTFDLNPGIDYGVLPNPSARATALAQPSAVVLNSNGTQGWIAAFASDRVARFSTSDGSVMERINLRPQGLDSRAMRGPRALVLQESRQRLYVLNKLSNTIAAINTSTGMLSAEVPIGSYDPMPQSIREGRGFLFDANLSGNGTVSCGTCHLDADRDGLAWDLGDPSGEMVTVIGYNLAAHNNTPRERKMHPMKGPMMTQTLRGLTAVAPFHWRGDRATIQDFNPTFDKLMGGAQLAAADMNALTNYLFSLRLHPNPNRNRDNTLPEKFPAGSGGSPALGQTLFQTATAHCSECHALPRGTNNNIDAPVEVGQSQPIKNPSLRTIYQRVFFNPAAGGTSLSGFGLNSNGSGFELPTVHPYQLSNLTQAAQFARLKAFIMTFDTGTAPVVGFSRTITTANRTLGAVTADLALLEGQASASNADLVVRGVIEGKWRSYFFDRVAQLFRSDDAYESPMDRANLLATLQTGDAITFLGVPPGEGLRFGGDRDTDGVRDRNEPIPRLGISRTPGAARLEWQSKYPDWLLLGTDNLEGPWEPVDAPYGRSGQNTWVDEPTTGITKRFFRIRKSW